jgi:Ca-activated chloride channel family protein
MNAAQQQAQTGQADEQQPKGQPAQAQQAQSAADKAPDKGADKAPVAADGKPESEQALALDQWLRWIPDDPAGLLRRKFMIEHMLKQQRENQP